MIEAFAMVVFIKQALEFAVHLDRRISYRDRSSMLLVTLLVDVSIAAAALWVWLSLP